MEMCLDDLVGAFALVRFFEVLLYVGQKFGFQQCVRYHCGHVRRIHDSLVDLGRVRSASLAQVGR